MSKEKEEKKKGKEEKKKKKEEKKKEKEEENFPVRFQRLFPLTEKFFDSFSALKFTQKIAKKFKRDFFATAQWSE